MPELDDATRERLVGRFGEGIAGWLDAAPRMLEELAERWHLERLAPIPRGTMSVVFRCRTAEGVEAVCKLSPDTARTAREAAALEAWTTPHTPSVLAADPDAGALLLEAIDPGTSVAERGVPPSLEAASELLRALHDRTTTAPERFPPLVDRVTWLFDAWFRELDRHPEQRDLLPAGHPARARAVALELAQNPVPAVLLHGDLNPGNVLDGGPARGLVAIDPAPCIGDPAFDATDLVFASGAIGPVDLRAHAERLAGAAGISSDRLARWCAAFAGMDGCELAHARGLTPAARGLLALAVEEPRR